MVTLWLACVELQPPLILIDPDHDWDGDGWTETLGDCDDDDSSVHPGADEVCDRIDHDCDGRDVPWLSVPGDHEEIADALEVANSGDAICVEGGVTSARVFGPLRVEVAGVLIESSSGSSRAIFDGQGDTASVLTIETGDLVDPVVIRGFGVRGGSASIGAGVLVLDSAATLDELDISENVCDQHDSCLGVGLYASDSELTISNSRIHDNAAEVIGDDEWIRGVGVVFEDSEVVLSSSAIEDNVASIENSRDAVIDGVGLFSAGSGALVMSDLRLASNHGEIGNGALGSSAQGGGAHISTDASFSRVRVCGNSVDSTSSSFGGGLVLDSAVNTVRLTNVIVAGNRTGTVEGSGGGIVLNQSEGSFEFENVDIVGNTTGAKGGGIYTRSDLTLVNANIAFNELDGTGTTGPAIYCSSQASPIVGLLYSNEFSNTGAEEGVGGCEDPVEMDTLAVDPRYIDTEASDPCEWDLRLEEVSGVLNSGDPDLSDVDGQRSSIGAHGGEGGGDW